MSALFFRLKADEPTATYEESSSLSSTNNQKPWYWLALIVLVVVISIIAIANWPFAPQENARHPVEVIVKDSTRIVADTSSWRELNKEVQRILKQENDEILHLIQKAKVYALTLEESSKLLAWLRVNKNSLSGDLLELFEKLWNTNVRVFMEIKQTIKFFRLQPGLYEIEFRFDKAWLEGIDGIYATVPKSKNSQGDVPQEWLYYLVSCRISDVDGQVAFKKVYDATDEQTFSIMVVMNISGQGESVFYRGQDVKKKADPVFDKILNKVKQTPLMKFFFGNQDELEEINSVFN